LRPRHCGQPASFACNREHDDDIRSTGPSRDGEHRATECNRDDARSSPARDLTTWCTFLIEHISRHPDAGPGLFIWVDPPEPFQISEPELSSSPGSLEDELVVLQSDTLELLPRIASWIWREGRTRVATFLPGSMLVTMSGETATALVAYALRALV